MDKIYHCTCYKLTYLLFFWTQNWRFFSPYVSINFSFAILSLTSFYILSEKTILLLKCVFETFDLRDWLEDIPLAILASAESTYPWLVNEFLVLILNRHVKNISTTLGLSFSAKIIISYCIWDTCHTQRVVIDLLVIDWLGGNKEVLL